MCFSFHNLHFTNLNQKINMFVPFITWNRQWQIHQQCSNRSEDFTTAPKTNWKRMSSQLII